MKANWSHAAGFYLVFLFGLLTCVQVFASRPPQNQSITHWGAAASATRVDTISPCTDFIQVWLAANGTATLSADALLIADYVNPCPDSLPLAARLEENPCDADTLDDTFETQIHYCCADLGDSVLTVLGVPDCSGAYLLCVVTVIVNDSLPPTLTTPADVTVASVDFDTSLVSYGQPVGEDNCCLDTTYTLVDYGHFDTACQRGVIVRTFHALDCAGNSASGTQLILVKVLWPDTAACDTSAVLAPCVSTLEVVLNGDPVTLPASDFFDPTYSGICPDTLLVRRADLSPCDSNLVWSTALTFCCDEAGDTARVVLQASNCALHYTDCVVNVVLRDTVPPECEAPPNVTVSSVDYLPFGYGMPYPLDNCCFKETIIFTEYTTFDTTCQRGLITERFQQVDCAGNVSECLHTILVNVPWPATSVCDTGAVVPPCVASLEVFLPQSGLAAVPASAFFDTTYAAVCTDTLLVRRLEASVCDSNSITSTFSLWTNFCCNDLGDTSLVLVKASVCPLLYTDCVVQVVVKDTLAPVLFGPAGVTVQVDDFDPSLTSYGQPLVAENCCVDSSLVAVNYAAFDTACQRGTIVRTFRVFDCAGNSAQATQEIVVNYQQNYFLKFPDDLQVFDCAADDNYGQPIFYGDEAELLATSHVDEVFTTTNGPCFKIERTWTVVNWCTYNQNQPCRFIPNPPPLDSTNLQWAAPVVSAPNNGVPGWEASSFVLQPGTQPFDYSLANGGVTSMPTFSGWVANANCYKYKQMIEVFDTVPPLADLEPYVFTQATATPNDPELWNAPYWYDLGFPGTDLLEEAVDLHLTTTDFCTGGNQLEVSYHLFLDLDRDGTTETVVNSLNPLASGQLIPGEVLFDNATSLNYLSGTPRKFDFRTTGSGNPPAQLQVQQRWVFSLYKTISGDTLTASTRFRRGNQAQPDATSPLLQLPYGTHRIVWLVKDGCDNETEIENTFTVGDREKPMVECAEAVSFSLSENGTVAVWPGNLVAAVSDGYTPIDLLQYTIRRADDPVTAFPEADSLLFDCSQIGNQFVTVGVTDLAGNTRACSTFVVIQDTLNVCDGRLAVSGTLLTEEVEGIGGATVQLQGTVSNLPVFSNALGDFTFSHALPAGADYTLTPTLNLDPTNGVTTFDLVLLNRHILNLQPLDSPYKIIAGDANKSGTLTTFDIVEFRKLILGIHEELPNNQSWRFIRQAQVFSNSQNPFADVLQESISGTQVQTDQTNLDFWGVKIGDLNGSVIPNATTPPDDRSSEILFLDLTDREVQAGEEFSVELRAAETPLSCQFTLNFNELELLGLQPGPGLTTDHFGVFETALTASFDQAPGEFTLHFRADRAGRLRDMLAISSRITPAEAYLLRPPTPQGGLPGTTLQSGQKGSVALRFQQKDGTATVAASGFELYPNVPNPWSSATSIGFFLPVASDAVLTVFDPTGRVCYRTESNFAAGRHSIALQQQSLPTGVLYYRLETATHAATRKMLVLH